MKRIALLFLIPFAALLRADTLDFGRQVVVITAVESGGVGPASTEGMTRAVLAVLSQAGYDRDLSVADFLAGHPREAAKLERMTLDARRGDLRYLSDGSVSVEYSFPLTGPVLAQLLPKTGGGKLLGRLACPCCGQPWPEGKEVPAGLKLVPYDNGSAPAYTGILIDCRGLGFKPALFPRVVNEHDQEVYGPGFVREKELAVQGMVGYYHSRVEAVAAERIGASPLVVRAIGVAGTNSCDPVVSAYDAARIHGSKSNIELLAQCKVGFLTD